MPFQYEEETLIFLVEERPALWDDNVSNRTDDQEKMDLWNEVFLFLDRNFHRADELGRQSIGDFIISINLVFISALDRDFSLVW